MDAKQSYQSPELQELGSVEELTQEYGWGLAEFFASIVSGGPISVGRCDGGFRGCFS